MLPRLRLLLAAGAAWACLGQGPRVREPVVLRLETTPPDFRFSFGPRFRAPGQRSLVLAQGGGAAKGIAHVGVLQGLEAEGLLPDAVCGTSIGAFMGAMHAVGYSGASIQELLQRVDMGAVLLDRQRRSRGETLWEQESRTATIFSMEYTGRDGFSFEPGSSSGLELKRSLQWLLARGIYYGGTDLDALRVPFRAVSTDLQQGVAEAHRRGSLVDAVRASMSIPGMFRPVVFEGRQHLDGMLVENLPVFQARALDPSGTILAVEVGSQVDAVKSSTVFSVLLRTLDVAIEERTRLSRQAADLLLRPDTRKLEYLEFNRQGPEGVASGRKSLAEGLPELEARLYGPEGASELPGGRPRVEAPGDLRPALEALIEGSLPPSGPLLRRDHLRLLRRVHAAGLAQGAELRFEPGEVPLLRVEAHPLIAELHCEAPQGWDLALREILRMEGVATGTHFNPARLARALDRLLLEGALAYRPTLDLEGTAWDPAGGRLVVRVREPRVAAVRIPDGIIPPRDQGYLAWLLGDLVGGPLDAQRIFDRMGMAESRLNLEELLLGGELGGEGPTLVFTPVPRQRIAADVSLAFESTWGFHVGLDTVFQNFLGTGSSLGLGASTNRLQDSLALSFNRSFRPMPRLGLRVFASHFEQRFLPEGLREPALLAPFSAVLADRDLRSRDAGLGLQQRFGEGDRGRWRLDLSRRWTALLPAFPEGRTQITDQVQASSEWDDFDRYTFPTRGGLLRVVAGQGRSRTEGPQGTFRWGYLRARRYLPLGPLLLHLDGEAGLGWRTPLDRWYSAGGPGFLLGTRSAGFLSPNFALVRVGAPIRLADMLGLNVWVEPRGDLGYLGGPQARDLREGTRVRALGAVLRTEVGRIYVELAVGRTWLAPAGTAFQAHRATINLLLGTRPWDIWKRR
ncbi:MAG: patatin-like phospholipase family protein [Acidobacteria bacterium]|nr:patatin-like phospholipase family protein [Acidobacteriota bacterium]